MSPLIVVRLAVVVAVLAGAVREVDSFLGFLAGVFVAGLVWNTTGLFSASRRGGSAAVRAAGETRRSSVWRAGDARTKWIVSTMVGHLAVWLVLSLVQTRGDLEFVPYVWVLFGFGPLPGLFVLLVCVFLTAFAVAQLNRATRSRSFRGPLIKANVCLAVFWLCQLLLPVIGSYQGYHGR